MSDTDLKFEQQVYGESDSICDVYTFNGLVVVSTGDGNIFLNRKSAERLRKTIERAFDHLDRDTR